MTTTTVTLPLYARRRPSRTAVLAAAVVRALTWLLYRLFAGLAAATFAFLGGSWLADLIGLRPAVSTLAVATIVAAAVLYWRR